MKSELAHFEKDIGTWDGEVEVQLHPGAEIQRSKGVMTNRLVGGRWLVADYKSESGFEGHGIYGWDDLEGCYVATWVDTMRGQLVIAHGELEGRKMIYRYEYQHDGRTLKFREETELPDDHTQHFRSILELAPGQEHVVIRSTYRKRS